MHGLRQHIYDTTAGTTRHRHRQRARRAALIVSFALAATSLLLFAAYR